MKKFFSISLIFLICFTGFFGYSQISASSSVLQKLNEENKKIESELEKIGEEKISLGNQAKFLDKKLEQLFIEKKIFLEKRQDFQKELENKIGEKTDINDLSENSEDEIGKFILELHRQEKKGLTGGKENFIKLFLLEGGVQKFFEDLKIFKKIEKINEKIFQNYELIEEKNSEDIEKFSNLKKEISLLDEKILSNSKELLEIKNAKETLLKFYSKQEKLFKEKLEENKKAMLLSLLETQKAILKQNEIDKKISIGYKKTQEKIENIYEKNETIEGKSDPYDVDGFSDLEDKKFIWPINKDRGITAKFLDPEYKEKFGIDHYAIDIRAKQGTEIKAPANAFVYKVFNGGMDYSYIILAHKGSIQTVYGHISKSLVKEGDVILKGQIFALTGGMPGTPGAGPLTTGPHLHLEFHENGKPVNPLEFLD